MSHLSTMHMEQYIPGYERYSYRAKEVLVRACKMELQAGRSWLTGPGLLAGLLADSQGEVGASLVQLGIDLDALRQHLLEVLFYSIGLDKEVGVEGGISETARHALAAAATEAGFLDHEKIEELHLLLGLIVCQLPPLSYYLAGPDAVERARQLIRQRLAILFQHEAGADQHKQPEPEVVLIDMAHQQKALAVQRSLSSQIRLWLASIGCLLLAFVWLRPLHLISIQVSFSWLGGGSLLAYLAWRLLGTLAVFLGIWLLVSLLVLVPLHLLLLQQIRAFDLLRSSPKGWLRFQCARWLGLTLAWTLLVGLASLLQVASPAWWWLPVWLLIAACYLLSCFWAGKPAGLLPGAYYPLPPGEIQRRCSNLLQRQKLRLEGIYVYETEKQLAIANAYATGWGPKRRIWLTDSLLKRFQPDEIEVIVAHEFAHHLHGDLLWRLALSLLLYLAWLLFWQLMIVSQFPLSSEPGLAALIMALFAFWLYYRLLLNSIVYRQEMRADRFALEQTGDMRAYQRAMIRLANLTPGRALGGRTERPRNRGYPSLVKRLDQIDLLRLQRQEQAAGADLPWQESVG
ncbi:M48 family metallopeptidase [Thermogemmatispora tikiterensis]|uniref:Peptidase M48 domain-containing protein n=1 Tax=Thermogemmatispora tikiterensis TaxID=1825093 RepID=A0A328VNC5_9CHLR|nr:M48 family metalloprotease [Thermogemmatispora tikiterensis]RAQ97153.1 hypothetical protein A4R35_16560 [Thermogemmatispora tikiterensis]